MLSILVKVSKSNEYKSFMIDKKYTNDFIKILQLIDNIFFSPALLRISDEKRLMLANLKGSIFNICINLCDHDIGISNSDSSSQDQIYMLENIPSISEIQDMLKTILPDLSIPEEIIAKLETMDPSQIQEFKEEEGDLKRKILISSVQNLHSSLQIIEKLSKNVVGQSILMYTEYSKTIRSSNPIICLNDLLTNIIRIVPILNPNSNFDAIIFRCAEKITFSLYLLAYNPLTNHLINNDKRKLGIKGYLVRNKNAKPNQTNQFSPVMEFLEEFA
jgi:hypothetical protein